MGASIYRVIGYDDDAWVLRHPCNEKVVYIFWPFRQCNYNICICTMASQAVAPFACNVNVHLLYVRWALKADILSTYTSLPCEIRLHLVIRKPNAQAQLRSSKVKQEQGLAQVFVGLPPRTPRSRAVLASALRFQWMWRVAVQDVSSCDADMDPLKEFTIYILLRVRTPRIFMLRINRG
jgi:hypothetical protein